MSDNIRKAMVQAIADMANPAKNSRNPHFRNTYADLTAVLGVVKPALAEHGLAVTQCVSVASDGQQELQTVLHHENGEHMPLGCYSIRPMKQDPQSVGSAITYARRYSLMAAFGLSAEDDDGTAASAAPSRATMRSHATTATKAEASAIPTLKVDDANDCEVQDWRSELAKCQSVVQVQSVAQAIKVKVDQGCLDDETVEQLRAAVVERSRTLTNA
jgi:hypothetical protein